VHADVVIRNEVFDLAVIKVSGPPPMHYVDILNTAAIDESFIERHIRVLGYPPLGGGTITVTRGIVSGFDEAGNLKTDAEINPGNSGGGTFDDLDTFIGIPSFITTEVHGKLGFIVSTARIKGWFGEILKDGVPSRPEDLGAAFERSNLTFSGENVDQSNQYPRILGKFAAIETLLSSHEYERAIPHVKFILDKRPRSALAHRYLGNILLGLKRYAEAATEYRTCLAYDPNSIPALGNLGLTLALLGRGGEALQIFEQIIDSTDNPSDLCCAYHNIGQIYSDWKRGDLSDLYWKKADELKAGAETDLSPGSPYPANAGGLVERLLDAIVKTEIQMEDESEA
jgi:hypothetical protein